MGNSTESNRALYKRLGLRCILAVFAVTFFVFLLPKLINILLPFVIAFIAAAILNPFVKMTNKKLGITRRVIALIVDLLVFIIIAGLISTLVYSVVNEMLNLANYLQHNWSEILLRLDSLEDSTSWLAGVLPKQVVAAFDGLEESIAVYIQTTGKEVLTGVISATTTMTAKTGNFLISFIITILAAYFVIADYERITVAIKERIGRRAMTTLSMLRQAVFGALGGYVRSQLLLALFAFVVNFTALLIYGQPYALLIGLFLGFVDLLPIVGTIAVNVPWGIIELIGGNTTKGIFLICLGVGFFLIRKVFEPKIVGSQTGLHPLAALMSTYVGLKFSGVWGAILGPMALMVIISIVKSGVLDNSIADVKALVINMSSFLSSQKSKPTGTKNESSLREGR